MTTNFLNTSLPRTYELDLPTPAFFFILWYIYIHHQSLKEKCFIFFRGKLLIEEVYFLTHIYDISPINFRFLYFALKFSVFVSFSKIRNIFCMFMLIYPNYANPNRFTCWNGERHDRDSLVVAFKTTYVISGYHH